MGIDEWVCGLVNECVVGMGVCGRVSMWCIFHTE